MPLEAAPGVEASTIAVTEEWCEDVAGGREGPMRVVTADAKYVLRGQYLHGKKDGIWSTFDPRTSAKTYDATYLDGAGTGEFVGYFPSGKVSFRAMQVNGKLHGPYESFFESGGVASSVRYENGDMTGVMRTSYEGGARKAEGEAGPHGRRGTWNEWDEHGQLLRTSTYAERGGELSCTGPGCAPAPAPEQGGVELAAAVREGVQRRDAGTLIVPRPLALRLFAAYPLWLGVANPVPVTLDGKPYGLQVLAAAPGSVMATLGFLPGDIVTTVNGRAATSRETVAQDEPSLRAAPAITVAFMRAGKLHVIIYRVQ